MEQPQRTDNFSRLPFWHQEVILFINGQLKGNYIHDKTIQFVLDIFFLKLKDMRDIGPYILGELLDKLNHTENAEIKSMLARWAIILSVRTAVENPTLPDRGMTESSELLAKLIKPLANPEFAPETTLDDLLQILKTPEWIEYGGSEVTIRHGSTIYQCLDGKIVHQEPGSYLGDNDCPPEIEEYKFSDICPGDTDEYDVINRYNELVTYRRQTLQAIYQKKYTMISCKPSNFDQAWRLIEKRLDTNHVVSPVCGSDDIHYISVQSIKDMPTTSTSDMMNMMNYLVSTKEPKEAQLFNMLKKVNMRAS